MLDKHQKQGKFKDKVIWIAGASSGIGEALVYAFISEGAQVIASAPFMDQLKKVRENCGKGKVACHPLFLDMEHPEQFPGLVQRVQSEHKRIDYLVHVAGISQRSLTSEVSMETFRKIMEINFFGAVALTKAVLPVMLEQGFGHIAATSSITGKFGFPLRSAYSASKHALHGFFESLQAEVMDQNIFVTLIVPGRVRTEISVHALKADGTSWGRMDQGQAGGVSAEQAARTILKALKKKKKEVLVGGKELLMVYIKRFFPRIFWKLVNRIEPT